MYACVCVMGVNVCTVSAFKKTFKTAKVQHEEKGMNHFMYNMILSCELKCETELSPDKNHLKNIKYLN